MERLLTRLAATTGALGGTGAPTGTTTGLLLVTTAAVVSFLAAGSDSPGVSSKERSPNLGAWTF